FDWLKPYLSETRAMTRNLLRSSPLFFLRLLLARRPSSATNYMGYASQHARQWYRYTGTILSDLAWYRVAWSLAQHYLVSTALLDVTFDRRAAAWFATHSWNSEAPVPSSGTGVIYRFDRERLEALLALYSRAKETVAAERKLLPGHRCFVVDIRQIPESFALRPVRQQ